MPILEEGIVLYEYGLPQYLVSELERRGHRMRRIPLESHLGSVNAVCRTKKQGLIVANADYRKHGGSDGF